MTHDELVERANRWLKNTKRCGVVLSEFVTYAREVPDAFGLTHFTSILVECKANRADFLADKKKVVRQRPECGMGDERYYMTPPDLVQPDEVNGGWGLLWVYDNRVKVVKDAVRQKSNLKDERTFLYSIVRRIYLRGCLREWEVK